MKRAKASAMLTPGMCKNSDRSLPLLRLASRPVQKACGEPVLRNGGYIGVRGVLNEERKGRHRLISTPATIGERRTIARPMIMVPMLPTRVKIVPSNPATTSTNTPPIIGSNKIEGTRSI